MCCDDKPIECARWRTLVQRREVMVTEQDVEFAKRACSEYTTLGTDNRVDNQAPAASPKRGG